MTEGPVEGAADGALDPDGVAEELYGLPRDEFVPRRNDLVKQARAAGDRDGATAIGELRKPSVAAWLANALAREYPDEVGALEQLGTSLREAQDRLEGDALRALSRQRHELIAALVSRARRLAREDGVQVGEATVREVERTVSAALSDAGAARALALGRLVTALEPGVGLGDEAGGAPALRPRRPAPRARRGTGHEREERERGEREERERGERERGERERGERERLERAATGAREAVTRARAAAEGARATAEEADRAHEAASASVADLRARLTEAETEQARCADAAERARTGHARRRSELAEAEGTLEDLERRLAGAGPGSG